MIRVQLLFGVVVLALWIYCLIDVISRSDGEIRNLPKIAWLLLVLLFPLAGSVAWLVAGRPRGPRPVSSFERPVPQFPEYDRPGRAAASRPEDDEQFLRKVRERAEEQRRAHREKQRREEQGREEQGPAAGT